MEVAGIQVFCYNSRMKKSEMTVSMPLTAFNEYETYKEKYTALTKSLQECFDDSLLKAGAASEIDFDAKKSPRDSKGLSAVRHGRYGYCDSALNLTKPSGQSC